jgi:hypothetical protein
MQAKDTGGNHLQGQDTAGQELLRTSALENLGCCNKLPKIGGISDLLTVLQTGKSKINNKS